MEVNREEALKAKEIAERRFGEKDFSNAASYAVKAKSLCPGLEGISQMVATFEVYAATERRFHGEIDHYSILGLKPSSSKEAVKRQYKKMAVLLHPDKNKCIGADGAFKLVSEAWTLLSDTTKRSFYDIQRNKLLPTAVNQPNYSLVHTGGVTTSHGKLDTFWTVCTSCKVQYEYLRKYVNKRLSCKNCRGVFIAVESGAAPANGSFPYTPWPYVSSNGHANHGFDGVTYVPNNGSLFPGNSAPGFHSGHGYEYVSNVSFQWSSYSGTSAGVVSPHGSSSAVTSDVVYQANGNVKAGTKRKLRVSGKHAMKSPVVNLDLNVSASYQERPKVKRTVSEKKRRVVLGATLRFGDDDKVSKTSSEAILANGNGSIVHEQKGPSSVEVPTRRCSVTPAIDVRKMLMEKARADISKKLVEMKLASKAATEAAAAAKNINKPIEVEVVAAPPRKAKRPVEVAAASLKKTKRRVKLGQSGVAPGHQLDMKIKKSEPLVSTVSDVVREPMPVPDSDFHDFDTYRSEECFKPKQIWALYDEDGMPRLYCLIREVASVRPFRLLITYLSSKTDTEFGSVNWLDSGFTKSCGNFRARNLDVVETVNIFSHVLSHTKAARGGIVQIYPKSGDIWALYRNWSKDWDSSTPEEVRHQYQMVEVLDDYSEEIGVCVSPLVKLPGFRTVYRTNMDRSAILWITRREMLRFSHRVPSWLLDGEKTNLPGRCWDLDPAATPEDLLNTAAKDKLLGDATPEELLDASYQDRLLNAATEDELFHAAVETGDGSTTH